MQGLDFLPGYLPPGERGWVIEGLRVIGLRHSVRIQKLSSQSSAGSSSPGTILLVSTYVDLGNVQVKCVIF